MAKKEEGQGMPAYFLGGKNQSIGVVIWAVITKAT